MRGHGEKVVGFIQVPMGPAVKVWGELRRVDGFIQLRIEQELLRRKKRPLGFPLPEVHALYDSTHSPSSSC